MDTMDHLNLGITRARELGFKAITTDLLRKLPKDAQEKIIRALKKRGHRVKYRGPLTLHFPHHLITLRKNHDPVQKG